VEAAKNPLSVCIYVWDYMQLEREGSRVVYVVRVAVCVTHRLLHGCTYWPASQPGTMPWAIIDADDFALPREGCVREGCEHNMALSGNRMCAIEHLSPAHLPSLLLHDHYNDPHAPSPLLSCCACATL